MANRAQLRALLSAVTFAAAMAFMGLGGGVLRAEQLTVHERRAAVHAVYVQAGIDPATMLTVGYARDVTRATLFAQIAAPIALVDSMSAEFLVGGRFEVVQYRSIEVRNRLYGTLASARTQNFDSLRIALGNELAVGVYRPPWFTELTAEYERILAARITHSDFYRQVYYEDAVDGWYRSTGGSLKFGIRGGVRFGPRYTIDLAINVPFTERLNSYGGSPLHAVLGIGYRF